MAQFVAVEEIPRRRQSPPPILGDSTPRRHPDWRTDNGPVEKTKCRKSDPDDFCFPFFFQESLRPNDNHSKIGGTIQA